ncbi:MAG: hypothetical protein LV479_02555 [Methylacidiphilales bacterium]|nr:hypothetical protein [Candidatus Methylacidiphilales bacterium]
MTLPPQAINNEKDGELTVLMMDTEIFGFPVAEWALPMEANRVVPAWSRFLPRADELQIRLVSCRVPAHNSELLAAVQKAGFRVVDCMVSLGLRNVQRTPLDPVPLPLREAENRDLEELEAIAGKAFQTGRYHLDPLFPRALADKRYAVWVRNALTGRMPGSVLVVEHEDTIAGFLVQKIDGDHCQGQLACVNPKFKHTIVMHSLLAAHTAWLQPRGIRKTTGRISIGLMQAINLNLVLHSELRQAEYVLHWHSIHYPVGKDSPLSLAHE